MQILGLSTALLITIAAVAIAVSKGSDSAERVQATGPLPAAPTTTTSAPAAVLPGVDGSSPPAGQPPNRQPAAPPGGDDFTPDLGPPPFELPDDPRIPPTPRPSTPAVAVALCAPAQVDQALTTDKASYGEDETVTVTATLTNTSNTRCAVVDPASACFSLLAAYGTGDERPFWRNRYLPVDTCPNLPRILLLPRATSELVGTWDQTDFRDCMPFGTVPDCAGPRVAGTYTIRSTWLAREATTTIDLT